MAKKSTGADFRKKQQRCYCRECRLQAALTNKKSEISARTRHTPTPPKKVCYLRLKLDQF